METSWRDIVAADPELVSVPLRGLDMWKPRQKDLQLTREESFSPLAGIRYVETQLWSS